MKFVTSVISATILCFVIGAGTAFAQAPAAPMPAASAAAAPPATAKTPAPTLGLDDKKKIAQECSAQANDKKLHGKDRRTFRATCIRHASGTPARRPG